MTNEEFIQAKESGYIGRQNFWDKYFKVKKEEEMNKKKILYIDMDGVIADFAKAINNINPDLDMSEDTESYEDRSKIVDRICMDNPNLFHNLEPMENSIETVKKLFDHFEVYFLSTPMWSVPESFSGKRIWIQKHFGEMAAKRLILTHRKDLNIGDFLIDDRTRNGAGEFTGIHVHYGTKDFPTWERVYEYLMNSLKRENIRDVDVSSLYPWQQEDIPSGRFTEFMAATPRRHGRTDRMVAAQMAMQAWINEQKQEKDTQSAMEYYSNQIHALEQRPSAPLDIHTDWMEKMWEDGSVAYTQNIEPKPTDENEL